VPVYDRGTKSGTAVSRIRALRDPRDAFAARLHAAASARRSLDVQYYIWHDDTSGSLLFKALLDAADRGVRVRLLIDDNNTEGLDATLSALRAHPNVEVRVFNPFVIRRPHWIGYLIDFFRLNHRMHNKSFTADRQITIVGGRNIGDEYFDAPNAAVVFADLDVMAIGPVAADVADDFDRYWLSKDSCPIEALAAPASPAGVALLSSTLAAVERSPSAMTYLESIRDFISTISDEPVPVTMISDDPRKVRGRAARKTLVIEKIKAIFGDPEESIDLVSPYFVPGPRGVEVFRRWRERGVKIRVLTNALEATDVPAVHAGYAKYRRALLEAGVNLYELRRQSRIRQRKMGVMGSSSSSLHAKTFAVDGRRTFVGSFNFDPRSARLNTEMGFVIEDPRMAQQIASTFDTTIPASAYEVHLSDRSNLYWTNEHHRYDREPGVNLRRRVATAIASRLPIEWLL